MPINGYKVLGLLREAKVATAGQLAEKTHLTHREIAYTLVALKRLKLAEQRTLDRGGWVFAYIEDDADEQ